MVSINHTSCHYNPLDVHKPIISLQYLDNPGQRRQGRAGIIFSPRAVGDRSEMGNLSNFLKIIPDQRLDVGSRSYQMCAAFQPHPLGCSWSSSVVDLGKLLVPVHKVPQV